MQLNINLYIGIKGVAITRLPFFIYIETGCICGPIGKQSNAMSVHLPTKRLRRSGKVEKKEDYSI